MTYLDSLFSLNSKVAIVTGASRGNGKAISKALLHSGAIVIMVDILKNELLQTEKEFQAADLPCFRYYCDITRKDQIMKLGKYVMKNFGRLDILVNNAGISLPHPVLSYRDEDWEKTYKVNLKAPFILSQECAKIMKKKKSGVIINITSINAEFAFPDNPAYQVCKGGLKQLTKSMALDLGKFGIRVNSLGPGYIRTNMTKKSWDDKKKRRVISENTIIKRWGVPADLEGAVIFLSSDASSYMTAQDIYVDGGWSAKGM